MSFEGYYQVTCLGKPSHYYTVNCYLYSHKDPCEECGSPTFANLVDETNGDSDGYDPSLEEKHDHRVQIWKSELEKLQAENKKLREALEQIKNLKLPEGFYDASFEIAREALKEVGEK